MIFNVDKKIVNDYVVEQGTDGEWTYVKWNSGIAECYCIHTFSNVVCTTSSNGWYRSGDVSVNFPSGLFIDSPVTEITSGSTTGTGYAMVLRILSYLNSLTVNFMNTTSQTKNIMCHIVAKGRWK